MDGKAIYSCLLLSLYYFYEYGCTLTVLKGLSKQGIVHKQVLHPRGCILHPQWKVGRIKIYPSKSLCISKSPLLFTVENNIEQWQLQWKPNQEVDLQFRETAR